MEFENIKYVYLIGIGGIGMSALARFFNAAGKKVAGYDKASTELTGELQNENIQIHFSDDVQLIPEEMKSAANKNSTLVIITPAIPESHSERQWFAKENYKIVKRAQVLGIITKGTYSIAVAGTHGKTTTSSIITHLLKEGGIECNAFLGGISKNYHSNILLSEKKYVRNQKVMVVEADEYDRSFHALNPDISVITSMDADHLDIYKTKQQMDDAYNQFAAKTKSDGMIVFRKGIELETAGYKNYSYSISEAADFTAINITVKENRYHFDMTFSGHKISGMSLGIPGRHNIENALAALVVALQFKLPEESLRKGLASYQGVYRRFDYRIRHPEITFIDDYAHHPEELRAAISSIREMYPGKKITGIFQPHLFSRTRDFASEFAASLSLLDELILLPIYPAREHPIPGVTSEMILSGVALSSKITCSKENLLTEIDRINPQVLVTLGAGDIDQMVEPLRKFLIAKHKIS